MGNHRPRPKLLAEKLLAIREFLNVGQHKMARKLKCEIISRNHPEFQLHPGRISEYEAGQREPHLFLLIAYGRLGQVHLESIADDEIPLEIFRTRLGKEICYRNSQPIEHPFKDEEAR
ncbi:MAG TPA: hypothetical protein VJ875_02755 [Pyrinomonadaceae bacterium]|nr:hypothetical protein [Pyrinomonadaceae bacterium]